MRWLNERTFIINNNVLLTQNITRMKRKDYQSPTMKVVQMRQRTQMLQTSDTKGESVRMRNYTRGSYAEE